jgi:hypothetical protein
MSDRDDVLEQLAAAHRELVDAGSAYLAGDLSRAIGEIDVVVVRLRDVAADLRRACMSEAST